VKLDASDEWGEKSKGLSAEIVRGWRKGHDGSGGSDELNGFDRRRRLGASEGLNPFANRAAWTVRLSLYSFEASKDANPRV